MKYSAEVWIFIRIIYENCVQRATIKQIIAKAQEFFPDEAMPSERTVYHRSKKENWQKKNTLRSLNSGSLIQLYYANREYDLGNREKYQMMSLEHEVKAKKLFNEVTFQQRKLASVILDHRRNNYKASEYLNHKLDQLLEIEQKVLDFPRYYNEHPDEFIDIDFDTAFSLQLKNLKIVTDAIYMAESMTRAVTNLMKNDFVLYGVQPDDTREPDTAKRLISLDEDAQYYAEQERIAQENQKRIAERMAMLQSGVYEEQIKQQAMANARQYQVNIEDAEFDEIL